jgi:peptidoglycan/LPS O-acetylase OafA/YrhL
MINRSVSFYLDFLRVLAAFYVFIFHVGSMRVGDNLVFATSEYSEKLGLTYRTAHYFVIVFFVLSGFLITMSASRPNMSLKKFMAARCGRLYSVLIPALVLSILTAQFLISTSVFERELIGNNSNLVQRVILNISFVAESWSLNATPPLNTPFWSVHYEFMYYLIIASFLLIKRKIKFIVLGLVLLAAGVKILLLFPCWLTGSVLYYMVKNSKLIPTIPSFILFVFTLLVLVLITTNLIFLPFEFFHGNDSVLNNTLFFSSNYLADYIFALLVVGNLYGFFGFSTKTLNLCETRIFAKTEGFLKVISNCSYTLYMFHMPLLFLFSSIWFYNKANTYHQVGLIVIVLIAVYFIAKQTEWKVDFWRQTILRIINSLESVFNLVSYKKSRVK